MFPRISCCKLSFRTIIRLMIIGLFFFFVWSFWGLNLPYRDFVSHYTNVSVAAVHWDRNTSSAAHIIAVRPEQHLSHTKPANIKSEDALQQQHKEEKPPTPQKPPVCNEDFRRINSTSCPECFRPRTIKIVTMLREITPQKEPLPLQPPNFYEPKKEIVQNLMTNYLIMPSENFQKKSPFLLALQMSVLDRKYERDAVRATWASVAKTQEWPNRRVNAKVKVLFVVAHRAKLAHNSTARSEIESEAKEHDDILYIDMQDAYTNLTLKILSTFKWVKDYCSCVKFVLKVDQDTFVNVPLLVDSLLYLEKKMEFAIGGFVYQGTSSVRRSGKWTVPRDIYPMKRYPIYSSGCGYVLAFKVVSKMADVAPYVHMFDIEDAFITGVLRNVIKCQMFTFGYTFTHFLDRDWPLCHMVTDQKVLGTNVDEAKGLKIWETFVNDACQ